MKKTELKRKTQMPRPTKPMERKSKLKPISDKHKASNVAQRITYAGMAQQAEEHRCLACKTAYHLQHSHILTQGNHYHQRANPLNIVYLCGDLSNGCHSLYEHKKAEFAMRYPEAYAETVRRMWLVDARATRFFLSKNPTPHS